ncbi:single-strand selective monofunctional uracil DNA glycosylase-like isoform X1 [Macrosteles quadrilineatus]|uniref:single-strand selective monofunctional uracil DNA glycosylase-like isoform X1 n=1 Tax=Macrosteles quadrilineatus TaxID=74068 RepID=UPI0023E0A897|nr:single-strand selective monofunctional uracil DNA glycosylase-like isoform X1 [Macrosteles quadrilineatus]
MDFSNKLFGIQHDLSLLLSSEELSKNLHLDIEFVYNPLDYAKDNHLKFLYAYANNPKKLLFMGINPGPWGMVQTGIPFGEVAVVRDWLKLNGEIVPPQHQHPSRLVKGFSCKRSEVSGRRFWTLVKDISKSDPQLFFKNSFIYNYYPLALVSKSGKNITPSDLKANEQKKLFNPCDAALRQIVSLLQVQIVVAIGRFAEKRAKEALKEFPFIKVVSIPHPSPRNAKSNQNWHEKTLAQFAQLDLLKYFT